MPNPNEQANPLFHALTMMLQQQARPSSTYVDAPYVAQQQKQRQQNAFEQAKQEDYFNKVRALNELRAQGTNPSQMFQKANNFVGDFVTGNNPQQMMENVAMNAVPIGKLLAAIAPLAKVGKKIESFLPETFYHGTGANFSGFNEQNTFSATGNPTGLFGTFFTKLKPEAERYAKDFHGAGGRVVKTKINLQNPYEMDYSEYSNLSTPKDLRNPNWQELNEKVLKKKKELMDMGYDGIIINKGKKYEETVVFNPNQINVLE